MRKRIFAVLALLVIVVLFALPLVAQVVNEPTEIDPAVVKAILNAGFLGITFTLLVQLIKTKVGISGPLVFVGSFIVAVVMTAVYFLTIAPPLTFSKEIGYAVLTWAVGNGWYKLKAA
jgi:hypothetical protein